MHLLFIADQQATSRAIFDLAQLSAAFGQQVSLLLPTEPDADQQQCCSDLSITLFSRNTARLPQLLATADRVIRL